MLAGWCSRPATGLRPPLVSSSSQLVQRRAGGRTQRGGPGNWRAGSRGAAAPHASSGESRAGQKLRCDDGGPRTGGNLTPGQAFRRRARDQRRQHREVAALRLDSCPGGQRHQIGLAEWRRTASRSSPSTQGPTHHESVAPCLLIDVAGPARWSGVDGRKGPHRMTGRERHEAIRPGVPTREDVPTEDNFRLVNPHA